MMRGFFITGTDTHIGKTIVTALLAFGLRIAGVHCCPIKPIGAGGLRLGNEMVSEDAIAYKTIARLDEPFSLLNPLCLEYPASPHFAATLDRMTIPVHSILDEVNQTATSYEAVLIEGVGGWRVPLTDTFFVEDMAKLLNLPVLVVSANRLGTINHTLLTLESIRNSGQTPVGVIFNYAHPGEKTKIHENNIETIAKLGETPVLGEIPFLSSTLLQGADSEQLWQHIEDSLLWNRIIELLNIPPKTSPV